jgi:hypothetical protein
LRKEGKEKNRGKQITGWKFLEQLEQSIPNHLHQNHLYESSESSKESRDVGQEILEALRHSAIIKKGLEETLKDLQRHIA